MAMNEVVNADNGVASMSIVFNDMFHPLYGTVLSSTLMKYQGDKS